VQLLLDTHAFIWSAASPQSLTSAARRAIQDPTNDIYISAVSAWEIVIKHGLGKISLPQAPEIWVPSRIVAMGFKSLSIRLEHTLAVTSLPHHHEDPFDRMLLAQATVENLTVVTRDLRMLKYKIPTLKA